jgi:hypothetical protein
LGANTPSVERQWTATFVQRLDELGWTEGRNTAIEYRWAEGRSERGAEPQRNGGTRLRSVSTT